MQINRRSSTFLHVMNRLVLLLLTSLLSIPMFAVATPAGVSITADRTRGTVDVRAVEVSLTVLVELSSLRSGVFVTGEVPERLVTIDLRDVPVGDLVGRIAHEAGLVLVARDGAWRLVDPSEALVDLDVVDATVADVVGILAGQCGIRNVMIDPGVSGTGTFRLAAVPCSTALPIVFETLGIGGELHPNSVLVVRRSQ